MNISDKICNRVISRIVPFTQRKNKNVNPENGSVCISSKSEKIGSYFMLCEKKPYQIGFQMLKSNLLTIWIKHDLVR